MQTAVQLVSRTTGQSASIIGGVPKTTAASRFGHVALFGPDQIVAYQLQARRRRARVYIFRTLAVDDRLAACVPGVDPRVRLLGHVSTLGRAQLVAKLFAYLEKTGRDPSALPDAFFIRVALLLNGRLPSHKILPSLLDRTSSRIGEPPWTF